MNFRPLPTPPELFRQWERGDLSREELQAAMAVHQRGLIDEMVEARSNPLKAYFEQLRNRAAARKWSRKIGRSKLREILIALGELEKFPPAQILWNAGHTEMPMHCYFRTKIEPVFRITQIEMESMKATVCVAYGRAAKEKITREEIVLRRDCRLKLELLDRKPVD
ncbi:MAG: hypothetical protein HKN23_20675 [Verrucomicrobiales bacterium]|nr:hypothetical protein [Verrucomicrobiales bacterium]